MSWESILQKVEWILCNPTCRVRKFVFDRPSHSNGKTGASGQTSMRHIQWHFKRHWRVPESLSPQCLTRSTRASFASCPSGLYRRLKRRLGCSLRRRHGKWRLVSSRKPATHKFPGIKSCTAGSKKVSTHSTGEDCSSGHRQHYSCGVAYINKEGGMRSGSLCPLRWRLLCWCNLRHIVLKARHIPGHLNVIAEKLSRQGQSFRWNGLFIRRYSTSCVKPGTVPRSTCLRPGTIANWPSTCLQYQIPMLGQWTI